MSVIFRIDHGKKRPNGKPAVTREESPPIHEEFVTQRGILAMGGAPEGYLELLQTLDIGRFNAAREIIADALGVAVDRITTDLTHMALIKHAGLALHALAHDQRANVQDHARELGVQECILTVTNPERRSELYSKSFYSGIEMLAANLAFDTPPRPQQKRSSGRAPRLEVIKDSAPL